MTPFKMFLGLFMAIGFSSAIPTISDVAVTRQQEASGPALEPRVNEKREFNGMGIASLILAIEDYLKPKNAYDPDIPDSCQFTVATEAGGNCEVLIQCDMIDNAGPYGNNTPWQNCDLNGQNNFTHPSLGDYSIVFTEAGGKNGNTQDGLHNPYVRFADINNWDLIDVQKLGDAAVGDDNGGHLCTDNTGYVFGGSSQGIAWTCGIPMIGKDGAYGISSETLVHQSGYQGGWCTFHITQFQRNEDGVGPNYDFSVILYDAAGKIVGQEDKVAIDPTTKALAMDSNLPLVLVISATGGDFDPVSFSYGSQQWLSNQQPQCNMGTSKDHGYQDGSRQGDCGFTCN